LAASSPSGATAAGIAAAEGRRNSGAGRTGEGERWQLSVRHWGTILVGATLSVTGLRSPRRKTPLSVRGTPRRAKGKNGQEAAAMVNSLTRRSRTVSAGQQISALEFRPAGCGRCGNGGFDATADHLKALAGLPPWMRLAPWPLKRVPSQRGLGPLATRGKVWLVLHGRTAVRRGPVDLAPGGASEDPCANTHLSLGLIRDVHHRKDGGDSIEPATEKASLRGIRMNWVQDEPARSPQSPLAQVRQNLG
jgi:hypothetical protein